MARQKRASPISIASEPIFLARDFHFIFKPLKLKVQGDDKMPVKGLDFVMKSLSVGGTMNAAHNYALCAVELVVTSVEPHQIPYLHHAYSIAQSGGGVKKVLNM